MENRERVLLIIPELIVGGAQRSLSKLSIELAGACDVWVAVFHPGTPVAYPIGGELLYLNVEAGNGMIGKANALRLRVKRLRAIKQRHRITVAISFLEGADYINVLSRVGEKIILSVRGSKIHDETIRGNFRWLRRRFMLWLYPKANHLVAVNEGIAKELKEIYKLQVPVSVIYNFYDTATMRKLAAEGAGYQFPVLITTGRLAREKGIAFLLGVFGEVRKQNQECRLVIVGDGPEYKHLVQQAMTLDLSVQERTGEFSAAVMFTGNQENVFQFLNGASLYLMASSSEGFPNGLVEAMACGVPVMSADCPYGPREILSPGSGIHLLTTAEHAPFGILMPMATGGDAIYKKWIDEIVALLKDVDTRNKYAAAGVKRANDFSVSVATKQWMNIISQ